MFSFIEVTFSMSHIISMTTTASPVTVACAGTSTTTATVKGASTSVALPTILELQEELPPPPLILINTMRCVAGLIALLEQQTQVHVGQQEAFILSPSLCQLHHGSCTGELFS